MTDKQLRRSKKNELIEMLYYMRKELDRLSEENKELRTRLDKLVGEALGTTKPSEGEED